MIVESWMTRDPIAVAPDATLREAAAIMASHKFRHLPVVKGTTVVGMVTRTDLLRGQAIDPFSVAAATDCSPQREVRAVMASPVVTTTATTPLEDAAALMVDKKIGALPVVRESGGLVGIITEHDALRALITSLRIAPPYTRLVFDASVGDRLVQTLCQRAVTLDLAVVAVQRVDQGAIHEVIVAVRGVHADRLADAIWSAGFRVKGVVEKR